MQGGKGKSLEYFNKQTFDIQLNQNYDLIYSFGDTVTDSAMYEYSNVGVIQGNAIKDLKDWFDNHESYLENEQ